MSLGAPYVKENEPFPLVTEDGRVLKVQHAFKEWTDIATLLKTPENASGKYEKCLFVSLPGAFTPT